MARSKISITHEPLVPQTSNISRAGTAVRIKGERGSYTVREEVTTEAGARWVSLWGGAAGHAQHRAVRPDLVVWPKQPRRGGAAS